MRSEAEIRHVIEWLEHANLGLKAQVERAINRGETAIEEIVQFNRNGEMLCALKWVTGEATITIL